MNNFFSPNSQRNALLLVLTILVLLPWTLSLVHAQEHDKIVEEVSVNWWQVPLFATDKAGKPVIDLKAEDVEVYLNGRRIDNFSFYKREFQVTTREEVKTPPTTPQQKAPVLKSNAMILVFDQLMSAAECTQRSKDIARLLIREAPPKTQFILLSIQPFKGLNYVVGPTFDKDKLLEKVEKEIDPKANDRQIQINKFLSDEQWARIGGESGGSSLPGGKGKGASKYDPNELAAFKKHFGEYYVQKSMAFFNAFKSLYLIFNSIDENKFVYFFSEGISQNFRRNIIGGQSWYDHFLKEGAKNLGRSGIVLFIVNPMGVYNPEAQMAEVKHSDRLGFSNNPSSESDIASDLSGENSLLYLAQQSGGKYLEGTPQNIVNTIYDMQHAYYEISFQEYPGLKDDKLRVKIKPKRSGIQIHSLRSLEKSRSYKQMNDLEKEIITLNLIAQNPLLKSKIPFRHAQVTKLKEEKKKIVYTLLLPEDFLKTGLDLFTIWIREKKDNEAQIIRIDKSRQMASKKKYKIECRFDDKLLEEQKKASTEGAEVFPYFALINSEAGEAIIRIIGDRWVESPETQASSFGKPASGASIPPEELDRFLQGAAGYCEKLKNSLFHFLCREEIVETRKPLIRNSSEELEGMFVGKQVAHQGQRTLSGDIKESVEFTVSKYEFSYRLLKQGDKIREEREWFSGSEQDINENRVIRSTAFLSQRVITAPLTLLDRERQEVYDYTFLRFDRYNDREAVVINANPKNHTTEPTIFGNVWIDKEDFSILKIEADPRSVVGYKQLKDLATKIRTHLKLTLDIEFDELKDGLRFPTKVSLLEKYQGGQTVFKAHGPTGWERNRTVFTYADYRFFSVQTDVSVEK